jgi:hypothetical protein
VALLGTVGCSVEGTLLAKVSRDELAVLGDSVGVDPASTREVVAWVLRNFGADEPPLRRLRIVASAVRSGQTEFQIVCRDVALQVGDASHRAHDPPGPRPVPRALTRGAPKRLKGEEIRLPARVFNVAHQADLFNRLEASMPWSRLLRRGRGKVYEPRLADRFADWHLRLLSRLESSRPGTRSSRPSRARRGGSRLLARRGRPRSPTRGYTLALYPRPLVRVAVVAEASLGLRLSDEDAATVQRAGLIHDLDDRVSRRV